MKTKVLVCLLDKQKEINAQLKNYGIVESCLESRIILKHVLSISDIEFIKNESIHISTEQIHRINQIVERRITLEPLAYILQYKSFWNNDFYVDNRVLIPRQDTEILIESFLDVYREKNVNITVADIGCGSGCIVLSLLQEYPSMQGIGVDVSCKALEVSRINCNKLHLEHRLLLVQSDMVSAFKGNSLDVIVSNPPYIAQNDENLESSVYNYEPHIALFADDNGLYFYKLILSSAQEILKEGGTIFLEVGYNQMESVQEISIKQGFAVRKIVKDLQNIERILVLEKII
jgi:release factor glutamine methyltransferase